MGRPGQDRKCHIDLRVNDAELRTIEQAAVKAGYSSTTPFVRDLVLFNLQPNPHNFSIWSWANWGFTLPEAQQVERASVINGLTPLEWAKKVLLWWSQEPKPAQLNGLE